ncbi:unnamed protein product [Strongylus vulgaris]|uniref:Uncharacterized protein n=1 Tax=Strongylus vulgaris TaxID=40348 RepID=A0A3P7IPK4_STRVU|nr:unnamed protein product [Strongylus vulgaris]
MDELLASRDASSQNEKQDIDDASFLTAQENLTMNRSFLTDDDSFITVKSDISDTSRDNSYELLHHDLTITEESTKETHADSFLSPTVPMNAAKEAKENEITNLRYQRPLQQDLDNVKLDGNSEANRK